MRVGDAMLAIQRLDCLFVVERMRMLMKKCQRKAGDGDSWDSGDCRC